MTERNNALHITPELPGNQYCMTSWAAASSTAMVMAQLYQ